MARKLAVSLVNASCIFEVFVSVIPVREYLATPLTLVAFVTCNTYDQHIGVAICGALGHVPPPARLPTFFLIFQVTP